MIATYRATGAVWQGEDQVDAGWGAGMFHAMDDKQRPTPADIRRKIERLEREMRELQRLATPADPADWWRYDQGEDGDERKRQDWPTRPARHRPYRHTAGGRVVAGWGHGGADVARISGLRRPCLSAVYAPA